MINKDLFLSQGLDLGAQDVSMHDYPEAPYRLLITQRLHIDYPCGHPYHGFWGA